MPMHYLADQAAEPQLPTLTCQETRIQITQRTRRWNRKPVVTVVDALDFWSAAASGTPDRSRPDGRVKPALLGRGPDPNRAAHASRQSR